MHYVIVTETYPPEVNGVALTVQGLERGLRSRGHQVSVVRPRQSQADAPHELLVAGLPLPRYPGLRFGLPASLRLLRHWRERRPHAIYIATEGPLGWSALVAARRLGIPVASGFHTRFDRYVRDYGAGALEPFALAWMRRFHNRSDATVVPTRELRAELESRHFTDVVHLPRAVDTRCFDPVHRDRSLRAQWGTDDDGLAVLHVGRIAAEKNLELAVSAFRRIQRERPDARMVWVGDGPARASLQRENPDFVFCGVQRGLDLARHYASGDLFLFASRTETFGNVTLEAMASGVPTVAFDYGAAREHLRGSGGGVAVEEDDEAFITAAARIATADDLRHAMSGCARQAVQRLSLVQVAADFDRLLHGLVDRRAGLPRLRVLMAPHFADAGQRPQ